MGMDTTEDMEDMVAMAMDTRQADMGCEHKGWDPPDRVGQGRALLACVTDILHRTLRRHGITCHSALPQAADADFG